MSWHKGDDKIISDIVRISDRIVDRGLSHSEAMNFAWFASKYQSFYAGMQVWDTCKDSESREILLSNLQKVIKEYRGIE